MTLLGSFDTVIQGMNVHAQRLNIYAHNVANVSTPYYKRQIPILLENTTADFSSTLNNLRNGCAFGAATVTTGGVSMPSVTADPTPGRRLYQPGHPQADANGYITLSNVDVMSDIADATLANRVYEANLAVFGIIKGMANKALEIGRGQ